MKTANFSSIAIALLLLSCDYNGIQLPNARPLREIHYDLKTSTKVAEKTFAYDDRGNLIREYYTEPANSLADTETTYEYDSNNNLIRMSRRETNITKIAYVVDYTYENHRVTSEISHMSESLLGYKTLYFYSGPVADSTQMLAYSNIDSRYNHVGTTFFQYDDQNQLRRSFERNGSFTSFTYQNGLLTSKCDGYEHGTERYDGLCVENEYNKSGQLVAIYESFTGQPRRLLEERFYLEGRLDEKRLHSFPSYDPFNTEVIRQIKFEY